MNDRSLGSSRGAAGSATLPRRISIAIDGPAGAGKSTVATQVARALSYTYVDTGAMYRALAWVVHRSGIDRHDIDAIVTAANGLDVRLAPGDTQEFPTRVFVVDTEITEAIRTPAISSLTSPISAIGGVRARMVALQQAMGAGGGVVMEGRDIGTVVLPNAELKVFLTATAERRARRRLDELAERGIAIPYKTLLGEIIERDTRDASRDIAPMIPAADAHLLDSDPLTAEEVVAHILGWYEETVAHL